MRKSGKCPNCGGAAFIREAMVECGGIGEKHEVNLRVDANPKAMVLKHAARSGLQADVCVECGYTEFYAADPKGLHRAALEAQKTPN
jgi:predicted nucleic-acid-binding Zn-ribbon protein